MKLFLTSAGFSNNSIINAFLELAGKPFNELRIVDIPTAANGEEGDKSWLIAGFNQLKELGFSFVDIVDIAALSRKDWEPRLRDADVLLFGGGNTFYLLDQINKSGLRDLLLELLKDKIYMGISAGSYVACPTIEMANWKPKDNNHIGLTDLTGLNLVTFLLTVHYTEENKDILKQEISMAKYPVRVLDDNQAISVNDGEVKLVGEGNEIII